MPCQGTLSIPLRDFDLRAFANNLTAADLVIQIPSSRLATILDEAEEAENNTRGMSGHNAPVIQARKWKKRKRTLTPRPSEEVYTAEAEEGACSR